MRKSVTPSEVGGEWVAHPSKSVTQRLIVAGMLAGGTTSIHNPSMSDDCLSMLTAVESLGVVWTYRAGILTLETHVATVRNYMDCGESGLCLRMLPAIAALRSEELTITGSPALLRRPAHMIESALTRLGVSCITEKGFPPLRVRGPLQGGHATVDGSLSSQHVSGLLMALPLATRDSTLVVKDLHSRGYVDLTLDLLTQRSIRIERDGYDTFYIPGNQRYTVRNATVDGDWSCAAFFLVAAALAGEVTVTGLNVDSPQPDRRILEFLGRAGAHLTITAREVIVRRNILVAFEADVEDCPDLIAPLAALAAHCKGTSVFTGTGRLAWKESDRPASIGDVLTRLGITVGIDDDNMTITGGTVCGGNVSSHHDHRIAMAAAIIALKATGTITIDDADCVSKSWPRFFADLKSLGGVLDE